MMLDKQRGSSWTNALLGINADEIHVCGSPHIAKHLSNILNTTEEKVKYGEDVVVGADQT